MLLAMHPNPLPCNVSLCRGREFLVVTGGNMSGKSTFCKMLALLQILVPTLKIGALVEQTNGAG